MAEAVNPVAALGVSGHVPLRARVGAADPPGHPAPPHRHARPWCKQLRTERRQGCGAAEGILGGAHKEANELLVFIFENE